MLGTPVMHHVKAASLRQPRGGQVGGWGRVVGGGSPAHQEGTLGLHQARTDLAQRAGVRGRRGGGPQGVAGR